MTAYLLRRLLLVIPTLWAIITINFFIVQIAPGGPVDQCAAFGQQRDQTCIQRVDARAQGGHIGDIVEACHGDITCTA